MQASSLHPNNAKVLEIWQNDNQQDSALAKAPMDVILARNLFLIGLDADAHWNFHFVGQTLRLLNQDASMGSDFLNIWATTETEIVESLLKAVCQRKESAILRTYARTSTNQTLDTEILLLPVEAHRKQKGRILGVYQPISPDAEKIETANQHTLNQFFFTPTKKRPPKLQLLVDNTRSVNAAYP